MPNSLLLLLSCLLLALRTVAQAPEKAVPDDLLVTAEIIGHSRGYALIPGSKHSFTLYVRLNVRNQTTHPRDVSFHSCSWYTSWTQKGAANFGGWGCEKNYFSTHTIPAQQSIVFYAPVHVRTGDSGPTNFALGFVDFTEADFEQRSKPWNALLASKTIYWSNELNSNINLNTTPVIMGGDRYPT